MEWLHQIVIPAHHRPYVSDAIRLSDDIKRTGNEVGSRMTSYSNCKDPLVALFSDLYEAKQEASIWRGKGE